MMQLRKSFKERSKRRSQKSPQMEPKWTDEDCALKPSQKKIKKRCPHESELVPKGSQNGAKIVKNDVLETPSSKSGSQLPSKPSPVLPKKPPVAAHCPPIEIASRPPGDRARSSFEVGQ